MTIDERIDKLTERHEALTMNVELLTKDVQNLTKSVDVLRVIANETMEEIGQLVQIALAHETRIDRLERTA